MDAAVRETPARIADSRPIASIDVSFGSSFLSIRPQDDDPPRCWAVARAAVLEKLAKRSIAIEMLQFTPSRMRFIVDESFSQAAREVAQASGLAWRSVPRCAKLSIVGIGVRTTAGIAYRALTALAQHEIPVLHFSDSNASMSLIVPEDRGKDAESFLQEAFIDGEGLSAPIAFDAVRARVSVDGVELRLGARQAKLLAFLIDNAGRVVEAEEASRHVFGSDGREDIAALRVHIHNLRKKIERDPDNPRYLVTVPAAGYLFVR